MMSLKEAREIANRVRKIIGIEFWEKEVQAVEVLDNRVTELETEAKELKQTNFEAAIAIEDYRLRLDAEKRKTAKLFELCLESKSINLGEE